MTDSPARIPRVELDTLVMTATDAVDCALAGEVADGYTALLAGLERAREISEGEPWGPALITRWQIAVHGYCERYGVRE